MKHLKAHALGAGTSQLLLEYAIPDLGLMLDHCCRQQLATWTQLVESRWPGSMAVAPLSCTPFLKPVS